MNREQIRLRPAGPFRAVVFLWLSILMLAVSGCGLWDHDHNGGGALVSALPQPSVNCDGSSCID